MVVFRSFDIGWDKEFGGIYYFLDSEGRRYPYLFIGTVKSIVLHFANPNPH